MARSKARQTRAGVRKRGDTWTWIINVPTPRQTCEDCGERRWIEGRSLDTCPACGGVMGEAVTERRQVSKGGYRLRREAADAREDALARIKEGDDPFPDKVTVREVAESWLRHKGEGAGKRVRPTTLKRYASLLDRDVLPILGSRQVVKVKPAHVQDVLDAMAERGLAARTIRQGRAVMHGLFRWAMRQGIVETNPVGATEAPQPEEPDVYTPTRDEVQALLREAASDRFWHVPILLAATTGIRRSEVLAFRWGDVDLDAGQLWVLSTLQRAPDSSGLVFYDVKSHRSRRPVPLPQITVDALREHKRAQAEKRLEAGPAWENYDLVCANGVGGPLDPDALTHAFGRVRERVGLPPRTRLHDLRHALGHALAEATGDVTVVRDTLGHARSSFTTDTYLRHTRTADRARNALDEAFGSSG